MTKQLLLASAAALIALASPPANAGGTESARWKTVGNWEIRVDATLGNACFMLGSYTQPDGETVALRFGLDLSTPQVTGYMLLLDDRWRSLVPGQSYPIAVRFDNIPNDGWATWSGEARNMSGGATALIIHFSNVEIWRAIAGATGIHVAYQGRSLLDAHLPASSPAVATVFDCQRAFVDAGATNRVSSGDPFQQ